MSTTIWQQNAERFATRPEDRDAEVDRLRKAMLREVLPLLGRGTPGQAVHMALRFLEVQKRASGIRYDALPGGQYLRPDLVQGKHRADGFGGAE